MRNHKYTGILVAGLCAGIINGLFGAGGGMVLIPLLRRLTDLKEESIFPSCVAMILPMCIASILIYATKGPLLWQDALPYLIGGGIG